MEREARGAGCGGSSGTCRYGRPAIEARPPYDELSHEIGNNVLSVRVAKNVGRIQPVRGIPDGSEMPRIEAQCEDGRGNKCRPGCAKVNVIPNKPPPAKLPNEEMFLLRASRQMLQAGEEMRNTLEIELRTPRNYTPLPKPPSNTGPFEIVPRSRAEKPKGSKPKKGRDDGCPKGGRGKKKKKKGNDSDDATNLSCPLRR